jgi:hypothetical protein
MARRTRQVLGSRSRRHNGFRSHRAKVSTYGAAAGTRPHLSELKIGAFPDRRQSAVGLFQHLRTQRPDAESMRA